MQCVGGLTRDGRLVSPSAGGRDNRSRYRYCTRMKVHLAIAVRDIASSVAEYSQLLGAEPVLVIPDAYALWRTEILNFSIRQTPSQHGAVRHVGFEDPNTERFSETTDSNGLVWERFTAEQQAAEIKQHWPGTDYTVR